MAVAVYVAVYVYVVAICNQHNLSLSSQDNTQLSREQALKLQAIKQLSNIIGHFHFGHLLVVVKNWVDSVRWTCTPSEWPCRDLAVGSSDSSGGASPSSPMKKARILSSGESPGFFYVVEDSARFRRRSRVGAWLELKFPPMWVLSRCPVRHWRMRSSFRIRQPCLVRLT